MNIVLFTESYPYVIGAEQTFLDPEIPHLVREFEKVVIVPGVCAGSRVPTPPEVIIDETYARGLETPKGKISIALMALSSRRFYQELLRHLRILTSARAFIRLLMFSGRAELARIWVQDYARRSGLDIGETIFYTYWFHAATLGIGLAKETLPELRLVSRAHGYDLYEDRHPCHYIPFREQSLTHLDRLFCASAAGRRHVISRYPWFEPNCEIARLGVNDPGFITWPSSDGVIRIVSCSLIIPIKRVDLLLNGIKHAARMRPECTFEWHHFGVGPLKTSLEEAAYESLPDNMQWLFPGYPSLDYLMQHYRECPVDLFMHVSQTEGGNPLAIQEALSCGIPVVAAAVGGVPEIVSAFNGVLMSPDPSPAEIAQAIFEALDNADNHTAMRHGARAIWATTCNAEANHRSFMKRLRSIRQQNDETMHEKGQRA